MTVRIPISTNLTSFYYDTHYTPKISNRLTVCFFEKLFERFYALGRGIANLAAAKICTSQHALLIGQSINL